MSEREAKLTDEAKTLQDHLLSGPDSRHFRDRVLSTGIGLHPDSREPCFFVYLNSLKGAEQIIPQEWEGFQVIVRKADRPEPL